VQNPGDFDFVRSWIFNQKSYRKNKENKMYNTNYVNFLKEEFSVATTEKVKEYWDMYNSKNVSADFVVAFELYFGIL
jgi:hypothetical protein